MGKFQEYEILTKSIKPWQGSFGFAAFYMKVFATILQTLVWIGRMIAAEKMTKKTQTDKDCCI